MRTGNTARKPPQGLNVRSLGAILDTVKQLGYNSLRLPISMWPTTPTLPARVT